MNRTVTLIVNNSEFLIKEEDASICGYISDYLKDNEDENPSLHISIEKVYNEDLLKEIISFCEYYNKDQMREIPKPLQTGDLSTEIQEFYYNFISKGSTEEIFNIINAANFLNIQPLIELGCAKIATCIKGKTPDEIRKILNIKDDFTPEEKKQIEEENSWCESI